MRWSTMSRSQRIQIKGPGFNALGVARKRNAKFSIIRNRSKMMGSQALLIEKGETLEVGKDYFGRCINYSYGAYNAIKGDKQRIRITEGCPWNHSFCYEPTTFKIFGIPELKKNHVQISDMNLLCKDEALDIIKELGEKRVDGKVVHYELMCGIDRRFLTPEIAEALKKSRFEKIRLAWDGSFGAQKEVKEAVMMLRKAGYKSGNSIMVFMVCNWKISFEENMRKMDLCKVWNVQVSDCYYDNQVMPNVIPIHWTESEIREFRSKTRKHNQLVTFKIDPEYKTRSV